MDSDMQAKLDRPRAIWNRENRDLPFIGFTGSYSSTDTVELIAREHGRVAPDELVVEGILPYSDAQFEA